MFSLGHQRVVTNHGLSRREWLRVGGLSCLGLPLVSLLRPSTVFGSTLPAVAPSASALSGVVALPSFGRAKSCLLIFLTGGPPQHETFDPKPDAPVEIRGPLASISTSVPGMRFGELLPKSARLAHRMSVIRSMTTDNNSHATSGYWMLTGHPHPSKNESEPVSPDDWPSLAAAVGALKPSRKSPISSIVLPEPLRNNPNIPWPGQNGGFMGSAWHPHVFTCEPEKQRIEIEGLDPIISELRLNERQTLYQQLDGHFTRSLKSSEVASMDRMQREAFELIRESSLRGALEMDREPVARRDKYGRGKFGQSLLLARRLIESGVRLVQVNWPREPGDTTKGNPLWDTHTANAERCRDVLCPQFDTGFAALLEDLQERGMLDETLVVVMGEFGRSPRINEGGGRDHWGAVFSVALAGAGVPGGQIIGASDRQGGQVQDRPVRPSDLAASMLHLLGIDPLTEFQDSLQRPRAAIDGGTILRELVGQI